MEQGIDQIMHIVEPEYGVGAHIGTNTMREAFCG